jgi:cyclopropane fatty-acyl-phospholipid synthase-like methyltransferase
MLRHCAARVAAEDISDRVSLRAATLEAFDDADRFQAATAILVSQHIESDSRALTFVERLGSLVEPGGLLFTADLHVPRGQDPDAMLALWREQALMSGVEADLVEGMVDRFRPTSGCGRRRPSRASSKRPASSAS